jgi:hypothetical protein
MYFTRSQSRLSLSNNNMRITQHVTIRSTISIHKKHCCCQMSFKEMNRSLYMLYNPLVNKREKKYQLCQGFCLTYTLKSTQLQREGL